MRVPRFLVEMLPQPGARVELSDAETHHALHVLRLENGSLCEVMDGITGALQCSLIKERKTCFVTPVHPTALRHPMPDDTLPIILEVACLKSDSMQWAIEKAVELGAKRWIPVASEYALGKFGPRWQHWADQALKQCGRIRRLEIMPVVATAHLDVVPRIWLDEQAPSDRIFTRALELHMGKGLAEPLRILIGPEGGWSDRDRLQIAACAPLDPDPWTLGSRILRAETAVISSLSIAGAMIK